MQHSFPLQTQLYDGSGGAGITKRNAGFLQKSAAREPRRPARYTICLVPADQKKPSFFGL
jgi:hypothetical protein